MGALLLESHITRELLNDTIKFMTEIISNGQHHLENHLHHTMPDMELRDTGTLVYSLLGLLYI